MTLDEEINQKTVKLYALHQVKRPGLCSAPPGLRLMMVVYDSDIIQDSKLLDDELEPEFYKDFIELRSWILSDAQKEQVNEVLMSGDGNMMSGSVKARVPFENPEFTFTYMLYCTNALPDIVTNMDQLPYAKVQETTILEKEYSITNF